MKDHNSSMLRAANEVIKNLKALFGRIDPNLDANAATISTLFEGGRHSNSHECLKHATQTALKNIKNQNAGFQAVSGGFQTGLSRSSMSIGNYNQYSNTGNYNQYPKSLPENYPRMEPGIKPDPYIKCHEAADKIENELLQLIFRIACFWAK